MRYIISRCLLLFISASVFAQNDSINEIEQADSLVKESAIHVVQDERMEVLLKQDAKMHKAGTISGYRIQIAAGTNRTSIYKTKADFYRQFNDIPSYVIFESPNFKLRVGNFRNRLEAYKALQEIKNDFPDAFMVRDALKLKELHK